MQKYISIYLEGPKCEGKIVLELTFSKMVK